MRIVRHQDEKYSQTRTHDAGQLCRTTEKFGAAKVVVCLETMQVADSFGTIRSRIYISVPLCSSLGKTSCGSIIGGRDTQSSDVSFESVN
jgi:hypothetical protein